MSWKIIEVGGPKYNNSVAHAISVNPPERENTSFRVIGLPNDQSMECTIRNEKNDTIPQNTIAPIISIKPPIRISPKSTKKLLSCTSDVVVAKENKRDGMVNTLPAIPAETINESGKIIDGARASSPNTLKP